MTAVQAMTGSRRLADERLPDARRSRRSSAAPTSRPRTATACRRSRRVLASVADASATAARPRSTGRPSLLADHLARPAQRAARRIAIRSDCSSMPPPRLIATSFDAQHGGFGGAPKFPAPMVARVPAARLAAAVGDAATLEMVTRTLDGDGRRRHLRPARRRLPPLQHGREWLVPHFEKMLYDNALLAHAYLEAYRATGESRYAQTSRAARSTSCSPSCARPRGGSPPPSMRTARA